MDVEIITIGDEIITGHIVDTNAAFIARQLTDIGLPVRYRTSVGDSVEAMDEAFRLAWRRARVTICTGGLGPTDDDITKKAIVKVFKRNLIFNEELLELLRKRWAARGIEMPAINQNQALLPQGALLFPNKIGSAVGICIAEEGRIFIALPGVPAEAEQIMVDEVVPYLKSLRQGHAIEVVRLRTTGIVESRLAEKLKDGLKLEPGVRLAYLPGYGGVDLRIIASADSSEEAQNKANDLARYVESKAGRYIYTRGDDNLEAVVGQLLRDNDKTLAVAESCTAGMLGSRVTAVAGASDYFLGGIIAYANEVKTERLGVDAGIIEEHGAVSEECALAMASGCRNLFGSDYALSITGIAGPEGGTEDKPVGTVYVGLSSAHHNLARRFNLGSTREINRTRSVYCALELLRRAILDLL
ncbi:MAG TPA: competence/damage-inducible protein A [candidate division Zixibacteria bacterium]|nr:competence/damage-inducible protein A [candidate division Zixibacteria bacterium]